MKQQFITSPAAFIGVEGNDIISFGSGQPDLPPPSAIFTNLERKRLFKYGLIQGEIELRQALAEKHINTRADNFVITNGASEALDLFFRALYQKYGSVRILVCRPFYYSYVPIITLAGHTPVYTDLQDGRIDLDDFRKKVKTVQAVIINSPSNPAGRIEDVATLKEVERLVTGHGVYLVNDDVYKDLVYDGEHYAPSGPTIITINSFSKTYSMCGLRIGYLHTSDLSVLQGIIEIKTHTSMNTNILSQEMALKALKTPRSFIDKQVLIWRERRDFIYTRLRDMGFDLWKPEGAFYVLPRIKNSARIVTELYRQHNVIVYDGAWFGAPNHIRLSYALELPKIEEGLRRIDTYMQDKKSWL